MLAWTDFIVLIIAIILVVFFYVKSGGLVPLEYVMVMLMSEEKDLVVRFGKTYEDYRQHIGAFQAKSNKMMGNQGKMT